MSPLSSDIQYQDDLVLGHNDYWFSLSFSSSDYLNLSQIRYAYKLEGFHDSWIETDSDNRIASFTSLPADDFVLKIKASNPDGSWNDAFRALNITVLPPWWQTWQAYLAYIVLSVVSIVVFIRYRTRTLTQRAELLEQKVTERTETINRLMNQKERMFANISHEFKTPLTLILNPLDSIMSKPEAGPFSQKMSMMKRNGQRLLRMVDQLLELSKLETTESDNRHNYSLV